MAGGSNAQGGLMKLSLILKVKISALIHLQYESEYIYPTAYEHVLHQNCHTPTRLSRWEVLR